MVTCLGLRWLLHTSGGHRIYHSQQSCYAFYLLRRLSCLLAGNIVSLCMGAIITVVWSLLAPENYDFESMKHIKMLDESEEGDLGFSKVSVNHDTLTAVCKPRYACGMYRDKQKYSRSESLHWMDEGHQRQGGCDLPQCLAAL